MASHHESFG